MLTFEEMPEKSDLPQVAPPYKKAPEIVKEFFQRLMFSHSNEFINQAKDAFYIPLVGTIAREQSKAYIKGYRAGQLEAEKRYNASKTNN